MDFNILGDMNPHYFILGIVLGSSTNEKKTMLRLLKRKSSTVPQLGSFKIPEIKNELMVSFST
jgi:hypothetical protein